MDRSLPNVERSFYVSYARRLRLTSSNINCFSNCRAIYHQKREKNCNSIATKISPHLKCVATLPCKMPALWKGGIGLEGRTPCRGAFI